MLSRETFETTFDGRVYMGNGSGEKNNYIINYVKKNTKVWVQIICRCFTLKLEGPKTHFLTVHTR